MKKEIGEIKKRLKEYHEHENEGYAYYHEEIPQVGHIHHNAVQYLEILIAEIERLEKDNKQLKWELGENIKQQITPTRIKQLIEELKQKFNEYDQLRAVVDAVGELCREWHKLTPEEKDLYIKNIQQALRAVGEETR